MVSTKITESIQILAVYEGCSKSFANAWLP